MKNNIQTIKSFIFKVTIVSLILLMKPELPALAGQIVGNGGDALVCQNEQHVLAFDVFEASLSGLNLDLGNPSESVVSQLEIAFLRLERLDPQRAIFYRKEAAFFFENLSEIRGFQLNDIPDSSHLLIPQGCKLEQLIVQNSPQPNPYKYYLVNLDIWEKMDNSNKASMVLHEIVYREALSFGHTDSRLARRLNHHLISKVLDIFSVEDYRKLLKELNFPSFSNIDFSKFLTKSEILNWPVNGVKLFAQTECFQNPTIPGLQRYFMKAGTVVFPARDFPNFYFFDALQTPWIRIESVLFAACYLRAERGAFL